MAIKHVDNKYKRIYNNMCYVYFDSKVIIFINGKKLWKAVQYNEKNLSAKKETKKKRAWIQKKNENF